MFLDVKELAVRKLRIRKSYAPGSIDFHSAEIKQVEPLEVTATAELLEGQIRIEGNFETKIELDVRALSRARRGRRQPDVRLVLCASPEGRQTERRPAEGRRHGDRIYVGEGLFLADVIREQVLLALPLKVICRVTAGAVPNCGANLNHEECRCETHATDLEWPLSRASSRTGSRNNSFPPG